MCRRIQSVRRVFWAVIFCAATTFAAPEEPQSTLSQDHVFSIIALVLPHNSLHNSKTLHNWPFFAFAAPAWSSKIGMKSDLGKMLTFKAAGTYDLSFSGLGLKFDANIELIHLLELGVEPFTGTALNYGETATLMGVYDPEKKDYDQDIIFTDYAYGLRYHAALTLPLLALLPKTDWTKIILKGTAELTYSAYTGADDGEIWTAGNSIQVNGLKYRYGGTLIYMLPFRRIPMAMVATNVSAFKHAYDFDPVYKDYNPGFKTISVTPMLSIKVSENWNGMLMAIISRDRVFENSRYPTTEEPLQKQVDSEWDLRTIMCIFSRKF